MRLRVKFNKKNYLKYIGHLDLMKLFQRTLNRAGVPVKYSKGFNPQPRFAIANPLSLGIEGEEEFMDIELVQELDIDKFIKDMNQILPRDVQVLDAKLPEGKESIAAIISYGLYEFTFENINNIDMEKMEILLDRWMKKEEILINRLRKQGKRKILREENILPLIREARVKEVKEKIIIEGILKIGENGNLRASDFMEAFLRDNESLAIDKDSIGYKRRALYIESKGQLEKPF